MALEYALTVYDFNRFSSFKYRLFCTAASIVITIMVSSSKLCSFGRYCNEYDTDDDEMGAVNKEAKPLRRLKQDPREWCTCENCSVGNGELLLQGKHTDC